MFLAKGMSRVILPTNLSKQSLEHLVEPSVITCNTDDTGLSLCGGLHYK